MSTPEVISACIAALETGPLTTGELARRTGCPAVRVHRALDRCGVERDGRHWSLPVIVPSPRRA